MLSALNGHIELSNKLYSSLPHDIYQLIIDYLNVNQLYDFFIMHNISLDATFKFNAMFNVDQYRVDAFNSIPEGNFVSDKFELLNLTNDRHNHNTMLEILEIFPNIVMLNVSLNVSSNASSSTLSIDIASIPTNIQTLRLINDDSDDDDNGDSDVIIPNLPHLQHIIMSKGIKNITFSNDDNLDNIEYINLKYFYSIDSSYSWLSDFRNLQHLNLQQINIMASLPLLPNSLRYLKLDECFNLKNISNIVVCTNLHHLEILNCKRITNISILSQCKQLQSLKLVFNNIYNFSFLSQLCNLKKLVIHGRHIKLSQLPSSITHLHLSLKSCHTYDVISSCHNLIYLKFNIECAIILPKLNCINLKYIDLMYLTDICGLKKCVNLKKTFVNNENYIEQLERMGLLTATNNVLRCSCEYDNHYYCHSYCHSY